jgi:hypothetical protein
VALPLPLIHDAAPLGGRHSGNQVQAVVAAQAAP